MELSDYPSLNQEHDRRARASHGWANNTTVNYNYMPVFMTDFIFYIPFSMVV